MLAKITRGNQITIPKEIVEKANLNEASEYLQVGYVHGIIYLKPVVVEERISPEQFEKFEAWALGKEKGDLEFSTPQGLVRHFKKRIKKS